MRRYAYPGSIVVPEPMSHALADDDRYDLVSIRAHTLRDIGRVPLWLLRRTEEEMSLLDKARLRREIGRAWIEEHFGQVFDLNLGSSAPARRPDDEDDEDDEDDDD